MGTKQSAYLPVESQKVDRSRQIQNPLINDAFNTQFHSQFDPYQTFNRRQSMVYNFNCLPPKPPRANAENIGAAANRMLQPPYTSSPIVEDRKTPTSFRTSEMSKPSQCPICFNSYDNPHVLPCQHTFCKKCIISMHAASGNKTIDCPICREKHFLQNGIESLAANYTMKRLIELESMAANEREKEKKSDSTAKCFGCQKYAYLKVCADCSYMLCPDCVANPDHDYIIESKLNSKKYLNRSHRASARHKQPIYEYARRHDIYSDHPDSELPRLKITLLCHSSAVEEKKGNSDDVFEDEFGKCKTFQKISISVFDRVITLKKIVEKKFGILTKDQILVYKDQILKSDLKPLSHYGLKQFSDVHIFDERDIKDSNDEEDLYGIYQDTNQINLSESVVQRTEKKQANTNKSEAIIELSSKSTKSSSSQVDTSFDNPQASKSKYSNVEYRRGPKRMESKRSTSVYHNDLPPARSYYANSHYANSNQYGTMTKYRRLDELFDRQININKY